MQAILIKLNVDHHFDAVANKTIEKMLTNIKLSMQEIIYKSSEFIFDDNEENIETKKLRILN